MNERNIVCTPENIISTFGLIMDNGFEHEMEYANGSFHITSKFTIKKKHHLHESTDCFLTDNYEDSLNPCIFALFKTNLNTDGSFITVIGSNNPLITTLVQVSNKYLDVYMRMYDIQSFTDKYKVDLVFIADYKMINGLSMTSVYCQRIKLFETIDDYEGPVETNVSYFVNDFIKNFNMECIDEHTDMEKPYPLIEMQRTINHMERI